jgi:hypothetical protein
MPRAKRPQPAPEAGSDPDVPQSIPVALRPRFAEVVRLTDAACREGLDEEYAAMARKAAEALARKRPSPLLGGRAPGWACGIVYAIGRVNFLFDQSFQPYLSAAELCRLFGVSAATGASKASEVMRALRIRGQMDPDWTFPSLMGQNPMAWMIMIDGMILDARRLPLEIQEELVEMGLIPYVPDPGDVE